MVRKRPPATEQPHPLVHAARIAGVTDEATLAALRTVPRQHFLPDAERPHALADRPIVIGNGQTASQPSLQARMIEAAGVDASSAVLEIGTGCGYQTALLARIAQRVVTIEIDPSLAATAAAALASLDSAASGNVTTVCGDGRDGWAPGAPYDAIIVSYGAATIADAWRDQLAQGGRLVVPLAAPGDGRRGRTDVRVFIRQADGLRELETVCAAYFVDERGTPQGDTTA